MKNYYYLFTLKVNPLLDWIEKNTKSNSNYRHYTAQFQYIRNVLAESFKSPADPPGSTEHSLNTFTLSYLRAKKRIYAYN